MYAGGGPVDFVEAERQDDACSGGESGGRGRFSMFVLTPSGICQNTMFGARPVFKS